MVFISHFHILVTMVFLIIALLALKFHIVIPLITLFNLF